MQKVFTVHIYDCQVDQVGVSVWCDKDIALRDEGAAVVECFESLEDNHQEIYDLLIEHRYQEAVDLFNFSNENITVHIIEQDILTECEHPNLEKLQGIIAENNDQTPS